MALAPPIDVRYRVDGPSGAPVLVLSHALGLSMAMWDPQLDSLARTFRVIRYDHRGHGGSPVPAGPYRIEDLGRDLIQLLDRLAIGRMSFCGLSLGGMVGLWLAANAPERVDRLIVCCTAARMPRPEDYARVPGAPARRRGGDQIDTAGTPAGGLCRDLRCPGCDGSAQRPGADQRVNARDRGRRRPIDATRAWPGNRRTDSGSQVCDHSRGGPSGQR